MLIQLAFIKKNIEKHDFMIPSSFFLYLFIVTFSQNWHVGVLVSLPKSIYLKFSNILKQKRTPESSRTSHLLLVISTSQNPGSGL